MSQDAIAALLKEQEQQVADLAAAEVAIREWAESLSSRPTVPSPGSRCCTFLHMRALYMFNGILY